VLDDLKASQVEKHLKRARLEKAKGVAAPPPLVSVLIPVYNGARFLTRTLESVASQDYNQIEVLVADDGSTDASASIAKETLSKLGLSGQVLSQPNGGEASADNLAFSKASGEFVVVLNSDDLMYPQCISKTVEVLRRNVEAAVAYPDWDIIDEKGTKIRQVRTPEYSIEKLVGEFICIPGPGALVRKSAISGPKLRDERYKYTSDLKMWLELSLKGYFVRVPVNLAAWRLHSGQQSASKSSESQAQEIINCQRDFFEEHEGHALLLPLLAKSEVMALYRAASQSLLGSGKSAPRLAMQSILKGFRVSGERLPRRSILILGLSLLGAVGAFIWVAARNTYQLLLKLFNQLRNRRRKQYSTRARDS
jgi:glycosyltransferase involved in cell wall biosynthesis